MDALYTRAAATASRLLTKYSQASYSLIRTDDQGQDTTWPLFGIGKNRVVKFQDGGGVIHQASELLVAAFDDAPRLGDVLTKNGQPLTVLDVKPVTDAPGIGWRFVLEG